jgi:hypothetical protein
MAEAAAWNAGGVYSFIAPTVDGQLKRPPVSLDDSPGDAERV